MTKPIPDIVEETGLSREYLIAMGRVRTYVRRVVGKERPRTIHMAKRSFCQRKFPTYGEYFDPSEYESHAVTDQNRTAVERLDAIVTELNGIREATGEKDRLDHERLSVLWTNITDIIEGRNETS